MRNITFSNRYTIALNDNGEICIKTDAGKELSFDEKDKKIFKSTTGEAVTEYSGLATDGNAEISWAIAKFEPNGYSSHHYHKERTEVYYIVEGEAVITLDGEERKLVVGDRLTINPGQKHQVHNESTKPLAIIVSCEPSWSYLDSHEVIPEVVSKLPEKSSDTEETSISSFRM